MLYRRFLKQDSLSLKLPEATPRHVLPLTPTSPDDGLVEASGMKWGPGESSSGDSMQERKTYTDQHVHDSVTDFMLGISSPGSCQLPYTPATTPSLSHPSSPDLQVAEQTSLKYLLASGKPLHPFLLDNYHILEELGAGGYGVVVRAISVPDMQDVAVKIIYRDKMPHEAWVAVTGWEPRLLTTPVVVPREAHILRQINHPGVIGFVDYFEDEHFIYLVRRRLQTRQQVLNASNAYDDAGHGAFRITLDR